MGDIDIPANMEFFSPRALYSGTQNIPYHSTAPGCSGPSRGRWDASPCHTVYLLQMRENNPPRGCQFKIVQKQEKRWRRKTLTELPSRLKIPPIRNCIIILKETQTTHSLVCSPRRFTHASKAYSHVCTLWSVSLGYTIHLLQLLKVFLSTIPPMSSLRQVT